MKPAGSVVEPNLSYRAWLQAVPLEQEELRSSWARVLQTAEVPDFHSPTGAAVLTEWATLCRELLETEGRVVSSADTSPAPRLRLVVREGILHEEGFRIRHLREGAGDVLELAARSEVGLLYGVFHLRRLMTDGVRPEGIDLMEEPRNRLRMINHWDNADGSVERGYAGPSIFYENGNFAHRFERLRDYARLLASVGINAVSINNVNVHENETQFVTEEKLPEVARVAELFRVYGIRLFLAVNFAAPLQIGGLSTADPLDEGVRRWWQETAEVVYRRIPDFGGFLVKADSEHRPGPFAYGRNHADGANMLADALAPYGGLVIWRCFVYNCMQDWRDRSTDRAKAAFDHFMPLDGSFRENVLLQIKNGPMDFQVREPASPLFGGMKRTNQVLEFQIAQEYTGQQRHVCYLVPQWKEVLDFDTQVEGVGSPVKAIISGFVYSMKMSGISAVSNIGMDDTWTGHVLAQANLYGYGRLIWNPELTARAIAEEWVQLTFGSHPKTLDTLCRILLDSWPIYESYTAPLGVGWMVTPHTHYGPDVDGYEYSRWGTYHFADRDGIGVDRTQATGSGFTTQYGSDNASRYESLATCPDELLLFFHHVPYGHVLHSGKTVIQHIYDSHFEGATEAHRLLEEWKTLEGLVEKERYRLVLDRLMEQAEHADHWRDVINTYFYRKSGVLDEQGRPLYS
ncbi:alpha-glucuronidase family glycosyl hydrolase [Gorillibacterium sp. CAU 1737]|uniref:alpha-glucuronidase family glycosyl hydrolase n=1 Tax=Gorillibacterium sp. CAU 1737 TaxID=3140362 RepID=UPI00326158FF